MVSLKGKVALVTGGAMGMGKSSVEAFAEAGAKVVIGDYNAEEAEKVVKEVSDKGGEVSYVKVDVSDEEQVKNMVQFVVDTYGKLDVALNNAAITPDDQSIAEIDMEYYDKLMSVDLRGVVLCMKYEIQQMLADKTAGSIINTSSVSGIRPQPKTPAYVAAKHGVIGLTKQAAMDYSSKGIRINSVAPGAIDTPMLRGAIEQFGFDAEEYAKQLSMLNRFAQSEEVAQANLWLASDLSSYVTGTVINVDGGYTSM